MDSEDSPARPRRLLLMAADAEVASAEAGSVGSRGSHGAASTVNSSSGSSTDSGSSVNSSTVLAPGEPLFMPGVGQLWSGVVQLWPGGATDDGPDPVGFMLQAAQMAARRAEGGADGTTARDAAGAALPGGDENASEEGSSARGSEQDKPKRRRPRGGKGRRGGRGFGQGNDLAHGRCMMCDVCDLETGRVGR